MGEVKQRWCASAANGLIVAMLASGAATAGNLPRGYVYLRNVDASILQEIRYASPENFVGRIVDGYGAAECILSSSTAAALVRAQQALKVQGLTLKVFDCYRPATAVTDFIAWSQNASEPGNPFFFPTKRKQALFAAGYLSKVSAHSKGNTVDVAIARIGASAAVPTAGATPEGACTAAGVNAFDGTLDFGTSYDCLNEASATNSARVNAEARDNRRLLERTMRQAGFRNYAREWWHFEYAAESYLPRRSFAITAPAARE
jgi:zinc D-Ala-D-Ala dipeptidase